MKFDYEIDIECSTFSISFIGLNTHLYGFSTIAFLLNTHPIDSE